MSVIRLSAPSVAVEKFFLEQFSVIRSVVVPAGESREGFVHLAAIHCVLPLCRGDMLAHFFIS